MNDISAMGVMTLLPSNKQQVDKFVSILKNEVLNGNTYTMDFAIQLKTMEEVAKRLRADIEIQDAIMEEVEKFPGKEVAYKGATFQIRENGTKYDYKACGDTTWEQLSTKVEMLQSQLKEREAFLKSIKPGFPVVDEETGEIIKAPTKSSTTGIVIKL